MSTKRVMMPSMMGTNHIPFSKRYHWMHLRVTKTYASFEQFPIRSALTGSRRRGWSRRGAATTRTPRARTLSCSVRRTTSCGRSSHGDRERISINLAELSFYWHWRLHGRVLSLLLIIHLWKKISLFVQLSSDIIRTINIHIIYGLNDSLRYQSVYLGSFYLFN